MTKLGRRVCQWAWHSPGERQGERIQTGSVEKRVAIVIYQSDQQN